MAGKFKFTTDEIEQALRDTGGFVTYAAKKLNCHYTTVINYLNKSKRLRDVRKEIEESYMDLGEHALLKKVKDGDLGAICFYLKCKAKRRGYVERQEITGADGESLKIVVTREE